jgi:hypothetical protein
MGEFSRILGIFIEPRPAFEDIASRPRWVVPLVLMTLLALAFTFAMSSHIGWEQIVRQGMESSSRTQEMTPEQRAQAINMGTKFAAVFAYVGSLVAVPAILLLSAAVLLALVNFFFGARLLFKQVFAIACYASLPGVIRTGELMLVMLLKDPADFDAQQGTIFDLGFYLASATPKWLMSLASSLDLFSIWIMLLMATGLRAASRKLSFAQAFTAVVVPWLVWVLLKTGWAAFRG